MKIINNSESPYNNWNKSTVQGNTDFIINNCNFIFT